MHPEKLQVYISKLLLFKTLISLSKIFSMHPKKLKISISKLLLFNTLTSFSHFLHARQKAQSGHLKAFALQYFAILCRIFSMHPEKLKLYISKLLLFNTLISFVEFSPCTSRSSKCTSQSFCSSALGHPFANFLHALREAQSVYLKAFNLQDFDIFLRIFSMHPEKLKVYISKLLFIALHPFDILFKFSPCTTRSSKCTSQSFCSSIF